MGSEVEADLKALRADFAHLQADVVKLTDTIKQLAQHGRDEGAAQAAEMLNGVEARLRSSVDATAKHAREKPMATAAATFGIGLVLGLLFSGRRA